MELKGQAMLSVRPCRQMGGWKLSAQAELACSDGSLTQVLFKIQNTQSKKLRGRPPPPGHRRGWLGRPLWQGKVQVQAEEKRDEWIALYCKEREHVAKAQEEGRMCVFVCVRASAGPWALP